MVRYWLVVGGVHLVVQDVVVGVAIDVMVQVRNHAMRVFIVMVLIPVVFIVWFIVMIVMVCVVMVQIMMQFRVRVMMILQIKMRIMRAKFSIMVLVVMMHRLMMSVVLRKMVC